MPLPRTEMRLSTHRSWTTRLRTCPTQGISKELPLTLPHTCEGFLLQDRVVGLDNGVVEAVWDHHEAICNLVAL